MGGENIQQTIRGWQTLAEFQIQYISSKNKKQIWALPFITREN